MTERQSLAPDELHRFLAAFIPSQTDRQSDIMRLMGRGELSETIQPPVRLDDKSFAIYLTIPAGQLPPFSNLRIGFTREKNNQ